jgi:hypothetical protein
MPASNQYSDSSDTESSSSSESSYYSQEDYQTEFENEDAMQSILDYDEENEFYDMRMVDKKYYIGCYTYDVYDNILLFVNKIHLNTFFKYTGTMISDYLYWYSVINLAKKPSIEIMQLIILPDDTYAAVIKTFWIKIIQRAWKKKYKELQEYISYRKSWITIRKLEIGIRIRPHPPGLRGLLVNYA